MILKIRHLFWKIFLTFWLASMFIMAATTFVVIHTVESSHFKQRHEEMVKNVAMRIIDIYEEQGEVTFRSKREFVKKISHPQKHILRHQHLEIYDGTKQIFVHKPRHTNTDETVKYTLYSHTNAPYQVVASAIAPPKFLVDAMHKLNSLQFFIILLVSTLVSFFLSWTITRPLKKLSVSSRRYAENQEHLDIPAKLLRRADEVGELARDFKFMTEEVDKNINAQRQLLHDVSHELRAPLARLQVAAGLIQQQNPSNKEQSNRIDLECERIDALIQQILEFSRMEQQTSKEKKESINLYELLKDHVENLVFESPDHPVDLKTPPEPIAIQGFPSLLDRAISNILRNACKYSEKGSPIEIQIEKNRNTCAVVIRDHGPGVKEAEIEHLLTPFYRSGNQMHTDGFGLGLSIAQRAMEKHGGDIFLRNHESGGLVVSLHFPVA